MASTDPASDFSLDPALDEGFFESMFPIAGRKRSASDISTDDAQAKRQLIPSQPAAPGHEYHAEHVDPQDLCCTHCPDGPRNHASSRPPKRKPSSTHTPEFHNPPAEPHVHHLPTSDTDQQFPDDSFEKFCQECNLDFSECPPDCNLVCPDESACSPACSPDDVCRDPDCEEVKPCNDVCLDPECTKLKCPEKPCFCQKCDARPCPLGEPNNECHSAHSAPTSTGTIVCYDSNVCHFQESYPGHHDPLRSYESYPCYSPLHGPMGMTSARMSNDSSAPTPLLSPSNYASMSSTLVGEPSPVPGQTCFLNISSDHCHYGSICCHGPNRNCGDYPSALQDGMDVWNSPVGFSNNFTFHSGPSMPMNDMSSNTMYHNNQFQDAWIDPWMLPEAAPLNPAYPSTDIGGFNKLDFLASAVRNDMLINSHGNTPPMGPNSSIVTPSGTATPSNPQSCVCKWQHQPGFLCLALFDTPEALHKHVKATHVDTCTHCFCQWDGCEASAKDFKQRSKLSRHLLGHAGYRPYACKYADCDKTFATNQAKDNHERTHTGERPYTCDRCGYTTTTHTQLQTHISALHEGKKPHKCHFCDFTCADSSNLSKHERTHQTLRPYRCPHAGCTFKPDCRWENLKRHLRRSGHCPDLLVETSDEYKAYRASVKRETDDWHKRNDASGLGKMGRRKSRV